MLTLPIEFVLCRVVVCICEQLCCACLGAQCALSLRCVVLCWFFSYCIVVLVCVVLCCVVFCCFVLLSFCVMLCCVFLFSFCAVLRCVVLRCVVSASVKVRFENIFAWPLEHTSQGHYLVVLYDQVMEYSVDNL